MNKYTFLTIDFFLLLDYDKYNNGRHASQAVLMLIQTLPNQNKKKKNQEDIINERKSYFSLLWWS